MPALPAWLIVSQNYETANGAGVPAWAELETERYPEGYV